MGGQERKRYGTIIYKTWKNYHYHGKEMHDGHATAMILPFKKTTGHAWKNSKKNLLYMSLAYQPLQKQVTEFSVPKKNKKKIAKNILKPHNLPFYHYHHKIPTTFDRILCAPPPKKKKRPITFPKPAGYQHPKPIKLVRNVFTTGSMPVRGFSPARLREARL